MTRFCQQPEQPNEKRNKKKQSESAVRSQKMEFYCSCCLSLSGGGTSTNQWVAAGVFVGDANYPTAAR